MRPAEHRVADRTPDQGQLVTGLGEQLPSGSMTSPIRSSSSPTARWSSTTVSGRGSAADTTDQSRRTTGATGHSTTVAPWSVAGRFVLPSWWRDVRRPCWSRQWWRPVPRTRTRRTSAGPRPGPPPSRSRALAASRRAARKAAERATPLAVTIDTLTPSAIPARGPIRVAGTVTNTDSVPWLTVNVYSFISQEPMTTRAQLAAAVDVESPCRSASGSPTSAATTRSMRSSPASRGSSRSRSSATCWPPTPPGSTGSACTRSVSAATRAATSWPSPTVGPARSSRSCPPSARAGRPSRSSYRCAATSPTPTTGRSTTSTGGSSRSGPVAGSDPWSSWPPPRVTGPSAGWSTPRSSTRCASSPPATRPARWRQPAGGRA